MPLEIPKEKKIYTTVYESFKGVDFTNDATNIWRKRTPTGTNMMPDESGRPFKRKGWMRVCNKEDFLECYATATGTTHTGEFSTQKCYYFELAGQNHIIIFTNIGVFAYREETLVLITTDEDCVTAYDRVFFFEGNGVSAFYIYNNYKMWKYEYDDLEDRFEFGEVEPYIPSVLIGCAPTGGGTAFEAINLLSQYVAEEFTDNGDAHKCVLTHTLPSTDGVRVFVSVGSQFDTELYVTDVEPMEGECQLVTEADGSYIKFARHYTGVVTGEDGIRVVYPRNNVTYTPHDTEYMTVTAVLTGGTL